MNTFRWSLLPAFRMATYFVAGILLARWLQFPLTFLLIAVVLLLTLVFWMLKRSGSSPRFDAVMGLAGLLLCAAGGAARFTVVSDDSHRLQDTLLYRDVTAICRVTDIPSGNDRSMRFIGHIENVRLGDSTVVAGENVRVSITGGGSGIPEIAYGMVVALRGQCSRPSPTRNPGEFSEKEFYEARGITIFMLVRGGQNAVVLDSLKGSWIMRDLAIPLREYVVGIIGQTTGGEAGEFLKGLLLGERGGISLTTREAFTNAGVAHVLAVSGSNVVVVAAVFYFLFGLLRIPQRLIVLLSIIGLLLYMVMTGSDPPVVRATIASTIFILGSLAQLRPNPYNSLGVAAIVVLLIDPRQVFDVGFQLSFIAVLSIVYLYPIMDEWIAILKGKSLVRRGLLWCARVFTASLAATIGTLPLTAVYFSKVSVVGLGANMLVIPAAGASVILGMITAMTGWFSLWLAGIYGALNQLVLAVALLVTQYAGNLPFAFVDTSRFFPIYTLPFYIAIVMLFSLHNRVLTKHLLISFLAALNLAVFVAPPELGSAGKLRVGFLDVGQGDAAVIRFPDGRHVVIDAGPRAGGYDSGARIVVPFLKRQDVDTVDLLMISHPHDDHFGGAPALYAHLAVRKTLESGQPVASPVYSRYVTAVRSEGSPVDTGRAGTLVAEFGAARLYVLAPENEFIDPDTSNRHPNINNTSVVVKVQYGAISFLFAGDAEEEAESRLVDRYGDFLRSDILKTGHHGSRTSSTPEFLAAVEPRHAVVSVGRFNRFRHPSPLVLARLEAMGAEIHRTDRDGAIFFETDGRTVERVAWR